MCQSFERTQVERIHEKVEVEVVAIDRLGVIVAFYLQVIAVARYGQLSVDVVRIVVSRFQADVANSIL